MIRTTSNIEELIRAIARDEFAKLARHDASKPYSSHALPPDVKDRSAFARHCREIAEAERIGKVWVCSRDAWARHRGGGASQPATVPLDEGESAESIARRSGLRLVKHDTSERGGTLATVTRLER